MFAKSFSMFVGILSIGAAFFHCIFLSSFMTSVSKISRNLLILHCFALFTISVMLGWELYFLITISTGSLRPFGEVTFSVLSVIFRESVIPKKQLFSVSAICFSVVYVFKTQVRPILDYSNTIWQPRFMSVEAKIESVQRRATKMIHGIKKLSYPERLQAVNLLTLALRDMIQV